MSKRARNRDAMIENYSLLFDDGEQDQISNNSYDFIGDDGDDTNYEQPLSKMKLFYSSGSDHQTVYNDRRQ
jgi:hypothetical protein